MKRLSAALILTLYASYALGAPVPITAPITTTTTIPGNSSLIDEITEVTVARNNIKVIPSSQIGQQLVTSAELSATASLSGFTMGAAGIASLAYYQHTGKDPVYAAAASIASAADALFVPAYQAFKANFVSPESYPASAAQYVGKEGSVGATIGNIVDYVKNSAADLFPNLKSKIASATPASIPANVPSSVATDPTGSIWSLDNQNKIINSGAWAGGTVYAGSASTNSSTMITGNKVTYTLSSGHLGYMGLGYVSGVLYFVRVVPMNGTSETYTQRFYWTGSLSNTTNPISYPSAEPALDYDSLKAQLAQSNLDAATADEIRKAVQEVPSAQKITSANPNPTSVPSSQPSPITNNDVSNFFTANTTNIYNEYLNTVNNGGDVNTAQAAADLAKAQEEEAEKETEEKFNQIPTNSFEPPYDPGPFDIPTRFTTFLSHVKSSGLFSFSSAFFNSLPGGGSPLLTVNGGQTFGTHTYDFSQAFSSGLPILKSVLLALFGFLSVRAVIMKR